MKKGIALLLAALMALSLCGAAFAADEWARTGMFFDPDYNMLLVDASSEEGSDGWYVNLITVDGASYAADLPLEGDVLTGVLVSEEGGEITVTVSEEGEDGLTLAVDSGETYSFAPMDLLGDAVFTEEDSPYGFRGDETVEEQVLYDEDGFRITATGLDIVAYYPVLKLAVENTSGRELSFDLIENALNGWSWDASLVLYEEGTDSDDTMYSEESELTVGDGETLLCGLGFSNEFYYEMCGITAFAEIGFTLRVFEPDNWEDFNLTPPLTVTTSAAPEYEDAYVPDGTTVYDEDGLRILAVGLNEEFGAENVLFFIDNQSEKNVFIAADSCTVNGVETEPWFSAEVFAGRRCIAEMGFGDEVTSLDSMTLSLYAKEYVPFSFDDDAPALGVSDPVELTF